MPPISGSDRMYVRDFILSMNVNANEKTFIKWNLNSQ